MYGDERPHDKTLKVNPRLFYFSFPLHISLTLTVFSVNPACMCVCVCPRAHVFACVRVCVPVCARLRVVSQQAR